MYFGAAQGERPSEGKDALEEAAQNAVGGRKVEERVGRSGEKNDCRVGVLREGLARVAERVVVAEIGVGAKNLSSALMRLSTGTLSGMLVR